MAKGNVTVGRYVADAETLENGIVVFLIGMRINNFFAVRQWLPTFQAMGPMLATLYRHPEKGFLGGEAILYRRGVGMIQYWRSVEDLQRFARDPGEPHLPAWKRFNQAAVKGGAVGVWHETYEIAPGASESIYVNMPVFGLAAATHRVPAAAKRRAAGPNASAAPPGEGICGSLPESS